MLVYVSGSQLGHFGGDDWEGVLLASSGLRPEMLLSTLLGTGWPTTRMI